MKDQKAADNTANEKSAGKLKKPLMIICVLVILAAMIFVWFLMLARPCDRTYTAYSNFVIEEGDDLDDISARLYEDGFIRNDFGFKLLTGITLSDSFRPGTYFLSPSMNYFSIIHTLNEGLTTSEGFTIPAGYTLEQIATALDRDGLADKEAFLKAAASSELAELPIISEGSKGLKGSDRIEGFLFPSDYVLSADADESMMIIMMIDAFANFYNDDYRARADEMGITPRQVLIMASMIEKETTIDKERAAISAVIHNRYNLDLDNRDELPKVPLCSPGKASIIAALYPEDEDYTHYVLSSKLDGTHKFTSSDEEYEALLEEYNNAVEAKKNAAESADTDGSAGSDAEDGEN